MFDNLSTMLPFVYMGLYTAAPAQEVEVVGSLPYLLMLFLSTAFSPGAGIPGLKGLRYAFPKFYLFCYVPGVEDQMEGCPDTQAATLTYLALSSLTFSVLFMAIQMVSHHLRIVVNVLFDQPYDSL